MRLRTTLVFAVVALILFTVLLVGVSGQVNARRSAQSLSGDVLSQLDDRIDRRVRAQLDVATTESAFAARRLLGGDPPSADLDGFARFAVDVVASHPSLTYMSFGRDATGEMSEASRTSDGRIRSRFLRRRGSSLALSDYEADVTPWRLLREQPNLDGNDPRSRAFYITARDAKHGVWTETYPFFGENATLGAPGLTYATPIVDEAGAFQGVLTADFSLLGTSKFLEGLDVFAHGEAFLVEYRRDGTRVLIAHPVALTGAKSAVKIEDAADPRVVALAKLLPTTLPTSTDAITRVTFDVGGAPHIGSFRTLKGGDLAWVVCTVAPEDDILGEVTRNNRMTLLIVFGATLVAIFVALLLGASISRPLQDVAEETKAIGRFELVERPPADTRIVEIAALSTAVEQMKRNLRSFRKYVPADVVRELVAKGEEARLSGRRETLTIHFSDIVGFTSIAETVQPEELVRFLHDYLDEMTRPILASGGTVDKFIGDAVMAFWGAPRGDEKHALHACEAALANRDRLRELNTKWAGEGRPRFDARAALHTGDVIVGNIGSEERLEYTVIGDAVNLASRLEGLNKRYGTSLMISESTLVHVKGAMIVRPLDRVSVKGKAKSVDIFELIGRKGDVSPDAVRTAQVHAEAFDHYLGRRFADAARIFGELAAANRDDLAARLLHARSEALLASPPPEGWDGTERMTTK